MTCDRDSPWSPPRTRPTTDRVPSPRPGSRGPARSWRCSTSASSSRPPRTPSHTSTAAEPILSEAAASGLSLVQESEPIIDGARHYSGPADANGQQVQLENYLFNIGPVVAKEFIAGIGMPDGAAEAIARGRGRPDGERPAAGVVHSPLNWCPVTPPKGQTDHSPMGGGEVRRRLLERIARAGAMPRRAAGVHPAIALRGNDLGLGARGSGLGARNRDKGLG